MPTRLMTLPVVVLVGTSLLASPRPPETTPVHQSDLDAFMATVLETRDENWKKLQQYVLDERELVRILGPAALPIWGQQREYTWYIREGFFVRSPLEADGVRIAEAERRRYEERFLRRAKQRDERAKAREAERALEEHTGVAPAAEPPNVDGLILQTREPQFIDSAYFLEFKFEEGNYALVGRETFEDREVLKIEYYPERLFSEDDEDERERRRRDRGDEYEATMQRLMNKVSLITLWVDPTARQIVRYTFENVNWDFLPAAWLVRVDNVKAEMTMSQPFPDVWLPRDVEMHFSAMLAIGAFSVDYELDYYDYREATTSGRIVGIGRGGGGGGGGGARQ